MRLSARRDALRRTLDSDLGRFGQVSEESGVGDHADAAVDSSNDEIRSQLVEIESQELGQIEQALQRIAPGVYGRCEFCGGKIPATRLNALPYANLCIDCQRASERPGHTTEPRPDPERWVNGLEDSMEEDEDSVPIDLDGFATNVRGARCRAVDCLLV
jgi:DnaK suppressor protein